MKFWYKFGIFKRWKRQKIEEKSTNILKKKKFCVLHISVVSTTNPSRIWYIYLRWNEEKREKTYPRVDRSLIKRNLASKHASILLRWKFLASDGPLADLSRLSFISSADGEAVVWKHPIIFALSGKGKVIWTACLFLPIKDSSIWEISPREPTPTSLPYFPTNGVRKLDGLILSITNFPI